MKYADYIIFYIEKAKVSVCLTLLWSMHSRVRSLINKMQILTMQHLRGHDWQPLKPAEGQKKYASKYNKLFLYTRLLTQCWNQLCHHGITLVVLNRLTSKWSKKEYLWETQPLCQTVNHAIPATPQVMETASWTNCQDFITNQYH